MRETISRIKRSIFYWGSLFIWNKNLLLQQKVTFQLEYESCYNSLSQDLEGCITPNNNNNNNNNNNSKNNKMINWSNSANFIDNKMGFASEWYAL